MNKKLLLVSSLLLVGVATPLMASCNKNSEPVTPEVTTPSVEFETTVKDLIVGDTCLMKAKVKNPDGTSEVVYSSVNPEIATIDEYGYVNALKSGSTEIRATYGKYAAKCTINVSRGKYTPTIVFKNIKKDKISTTVGSSIDITPKILFNLKEYDFSPEFGLTNPIGNIVGFSFIATEVGETVLNVRGEFDGVAATPISLKINVKENVVITMKEVGGIEDNSVILFTYGEFQGQTFKQSYTPEFGVYVDGELVPGAQVSVQCDTKSLITYDSSTHKVQVSSNPVAGETKYVVTYTNASGVVFTKEFPIYVNKPVVDYEGATYDVDKYGSDLNSKEIFKNFKSQTLTKVTSEDGKTEYEVEPNTGRVKELPSLSSFEERVVTQKFIIYNDVFGFKVKVNVYDKIIRTFDDLKFFNMKESTTTFIGDYYLANDIDGNGQTLPHHIRTMGEGYNSWGEVGFRGVFDGRGHTLSNFKVGEGGIFGNLGKDSVVKNLAIKNIDFVSEANHDDTPIIAPYTNGATVENVYVYGTKIPARWNNGFVFCNVMSNCKISNCLFTCDVDPSTVTVASYGSLANMCGEPNAIGSKDVFSNTYIVSKLNATVDTRTTGKEYVVDAVGFYEGPYTSYTYKNLNHDKTIEDMKKKQYDFSSFNEYWTVNDGELVWVGAK